MKSIACAWVPVSEEDRDSNMDAAVRTANNLVRGRRLDVIQVESVYASRWLGFGVRVVGLRIWHYVQQDSADGTESFKGVERRSR